MMRWLLVVLVAAAGGCVSPGAREAQRFYVLEAVPPPPAEAKPARASALLVAATTASSFYDTQGIAYSRSPGTRAYYQHSSWTERPSRRIQALLISRLEQAGAFRTVAPAGSGVRGGLVLSTHLEELYHDAADSPGSVRITLAAELTDPASRTRVARRSFNRSAPADSYDAPGAVHGFDRALGALLDDVAGWVDSAAPR